MCWDRKSLCFWMVKKNCRDGIRQPGMERVKMERIILRGLFRLGLSIPAILLFSFIFFHLFSCNRIVNPITNSNNETKLLLSKIFADGKLLNEYVYDENNNLILLKVFHEDSLTHTESYQYHADHRLEKRLYNGFVETFTYDEEGLLIKMTRFYEKTDNTWEEIYHYSNSRIDTGITYFNGEKTGYILYQYDQAGNTIERKEYDNLNNVLASEHLFSFDSKKSPFAISFPIDMVQNNNIIEYYHYLVIMSYLPPQYESSFEYNSADLPVKETRMYLGSKEPVLYEYVYVSKRM